SRAWLTHRDRERAAAASLLAVAALHAAAGMIPERPDVPAWAEGARRWTDAPPWAARVVEAALRHAGDAGAASSEARAAGLDPALVSGLAALAGGSPPAGPPAHLVEAARALSSLPPS
ncbi:MAG TPA: hypothetical protein VMR21_12130, partial [Vicinamibacteria bacterium]|nr:hypothetical protein [Vicinamibacteria bacterium]